MHSNANTYANSIAATGVLEIRLTQCELGKIQKHGHIFFYFCIDISTILFAPKYSVHKSDSVSQSNTSFGTFAMLVLVLVLVLVLYSAEMCGAVL